MRGTTAILGMVAAAAMLCAQDLSRPLAIAQFGSAVAMTTSSHSFAAQGPIPHQHADYGEKISPDLAWAGMPGSTRSLVVIAEDPDAAEPTPFVHWVVYNLPAAFAALPDSVPPALRLPEFGGALQGRNSRGTTGYVGPRPPKGDRAHHYHFQVFAVDAMLNLNPGASAAEVLAAMRGHVVGRGELVGLYRAP